MREGSCGWVYSMNEKGMKSGWDVGGFCACCVGIEAAFWFRDPGETC